MDPSGRRKKGQRSTKEKAPAITSSAASEEVQGSDNLLTEILLRLPAKSLFRFKVVSRRWLSLISDPSLASLWKPKSASGLLKRKYMRRDNRNYNSSMFYFIPLDADKKDDDVPKACVRSIDSIDESIDILQSCNGLILCHSPSRSGATSAELKYCICNPLTRKFTVIPKPYGWIEYSVSMSLAADLSSSTEFKVVAVTKHPGGIRIEIYSSETGAWRLVADNFRPDNYIFNYESGFFWNSAIFFRPCITSLHYFHLVTEHIGFIPMPEKGQYFIHYFGESNGHLHVIKLDHPDVVVFELKNDYSGWHVKYIIDLNVLGKNSISSACFETKEVQVLSLIRRENEEKSCLVLHRNGEILCLNLATGNCQKLCDLVMCYTDQAELRNKSWKVVHQYIETPFWF